ncbi:MAG: DNA polymerase A family protein [Planctomycetota bacterium]
MDDVEMKLIPVVADLEENGYKIDRTHFERLRERLMPEQGDALSRIRSTLGAEFNPNSADQIRKLIYDDLKVSITRRTKSGQPSTDSLALQLANGAHPVVGDIARYRELAKILNTYSKIPDKADDDDRLRVSYNQLAAETGRFSSQSVIQTLPKDDRFQIRHGFVAEPGHLIVGADFDQQELRVLMRCSRDKNMQTAIANGVDLHGLVAVKVFKLACEPNEVKVKFPQERNRVKAIQFGLIYGRSAHSLAEELQIERAEAEQLIADYFKQFPMVKELIEKTHQRLMRDGFIDDIFGRRRYFPAVDQKLPRRKEWRNMSESERAAVRAVGKAKREAQNFLIQGASATITKLAMIRCHEHITAEHPGIKMLLTLHDELQFEVLESLVTHFANELPGLMCDLGLERFGFNVPMKVEVKVGPSWGSLKKWEGTNVTG